jgi:opacity protein-like surface antigen
MSQENISLTALCRNRHLAGAAIAGTVLLLLAIDCQAQDPPQDHSCTVYVGGEFTSPHGKDGNNFTSGGGFQAGGGFAVTPQAEPGHGVNLYITVSFMYDRLAATAPALAQAIAGDTTGQLASATSAHGSFYATTLDPTVRYLINRRTSLYLLGGFGWFRRGVEFNGAKPSTLIQSGGFTLDKLSANSGAFDVGAGVNFGLTHNGGLMVYAEARVYRGLAVNSGTTLLPLSVGVRW